MVTDTRPRLRSTSAGVALSSEQVAFWGVTLVVFFSQMGFALVMNGRGYLWGDAVSRSSAALIALYGSDPHLAAIGLVWMPLPTLLELAPVAFYPWWPEVVASGFASSLITVLAGTLTAWIIFGTARRLALPLRVTVLYTLLVSFSPMLFLYFTNGMSEGVAAPFMIGSVCSVLLFWHTGERRYVALGGVALALAFACLYQAVNFGAVLLGALVLGIMSAENVPSAPQGRARAIEGLSILFLVPSVYVAVLWVVANAAIMGDPFYFATSAYSNEGYISATGAGRIADAVRGDLAATLWFSIVRTAPFFLPIIAILAVRLIEGRLWRPNTFSLTALALCVPFGLITLQLYEGSSFGWLRYFMYPLFVAAGWGLYEIARSSRRTLATALVLGGWLAAAPASIVAMNDPELGQNEYLVVRAVWNGEHARDAGYPMYFEDVAPVAAAIDALPAGSLVLADASNAWTVAATVSRGSLKQMLVLTADKRFHPALEDPARRGITYLLVPNPAAAPQDLLNARFPALWAGQEPGFRLKADFPSTGTGWRLYEVEQ